ncbi:MAG: hypothetical protein R3Y04_02280 [Rikenellaceae bacterium]
MKLFDKTKTVVSKEKTTEGFYFGAPEAESEVNINGHLLSDVFLDLFDINDKISNGKYVITGRKGSGKSAVAQYYKQLSETEDDIFAYIITPNDISLNRVLQGLPNVKSELIFRWVILTKLIGLIINSNRTDYAKHISNLKKFHDRNMGSFDLSQYDISEMSTKTEIGFDLFRSKFSNIISKHIKDKRLIKMQFYEFIPVLEEILREVLKYQVYEDDTFIIAFDELDIDFKSKNSDDIMRLVRVVRGYNNNIFNGTPLKIILFLRDDIKNCISASDKTKIFSSCEYCINWYIHDDFERDEKDVKLRQFINKRISANFTKRGIKFDSNDPWSTLFANSDRCYTKSAFSYILDYTFYRPRDFINLLQPLGDLKLKYPLRRADVINLINKLAVVTYEDIKDELLIHFNSDEISNIGYILKEVVSRDRISYSDLCELFKKYGIHESNINIFMDYSLIVPNKKNIYYHTYREKKLDEPIENYLFSTHKAITPYFKNLK